MRPIGVAVLDQMVGGIAPGLPLVLAGASGSGRTVLALEIARAALDAGDVVTLLCAEPPPFLIQQARTLGMDLEPAVRLGQLVLLEMDPRIAALVRTQGAGALAKSLRAEETLASLLVVDPFTALTAELVDEPLLRATVREFVSLVSPMRMALTLEAERLELQQGLERVLGEVCGAFVRLHREPAGRRTLTLAKTRAGVAESEVVEFAIGEEGTRIVRPRPDRARRRDAGETAEEPPPPADLESRAAPASPGPVPEPCEPPGPKTVLVVDGDRATRDLVAKWLSDRFAVVTAGDGFEAMTTLLTHRPDLVVLDLVMPKVTGYEVLAAFQRAAPEIPTLVVSGAIRRPRDRLGPIVLGATDVLAKPVERFELVHKVETLLRLSGPAPRVVDPSDAQALFGTPSTSRLIEAVDFHARLSRAASFGERYGLPSSLVLVSGASGDGVDRLVELADSQLRFEDALLRVSRRRVLVLLVATEPADAPEVMQRLCRHLAQDGARRPRLRWSVVEARAVAPDHDWNAAFRSVDEGD